MAGTNLTRAPLELAIPYVEMVDDDRTLAATLKELVHTPNRIIALRTRGNTGGQLAKLLHRLVTAPRDDAKTLDLCDAWMAGFPELIALDAPCEQHRLYQWIDSAAEAYLRAR